MLVVGGNRKAGNESIVFLKQVFLPNPVGTVFNSRVCFYLTAATLRVCLLLFVPAA
jgi:hypothetical protein